MKPKKKVKPIVLSNDDEEIIPRIKTKSSKKKTWIFIAGGVLIALFILYKLFSQSLETVKDSVVMVEVYNESGELVSRGSGFCVFDSNYIVTNFHVIEGAYKIKYVTDDSYEYDVSDVLIFDVENDLAIMYSNNELKPLKMGLGTNLKMGQKVKTIGSPLGQLNTLSTGIISNIDDSGIIQITAPISHGNSGGVLLNSFNNVIGVTYATIENGQNLNYAININVVRELYKKYEEENYSSISEDYYFWAVKKETMSLSDSYVYAPKSLYAFYKATNRRKIFDYYYSNEKSYTSLTEKEKTEIVALFDDLDDGTVPLFLDIKKDSIDTIALTIGSFDKADLAIAKVGIKGKSNKSKQFNYVNSMSLSVEDKIILLFFYSKNGPGDLTDKDNKSFIKFVGNLSIDYDDKVYLLKSVGYKVDSKGNVKWYYN